MNNKLLKSIFALVSAIISVNVFGLVSDNFLGITIILFILFFFYSFILKNISFDKRKVTISLLLAFIYTILNLLGNIVINDLVVSFSFVINIIGNLILFSFICLFLFSKIEDLIKVREKFSFKFNIYKIKHFKLIVMIILFVCYIPAFIASFPGVFAYDAPHQVSQFITSNIGNNQPVVSSLFIYLIMSIGKFIFSSWEGGLTLFIIVQMFICFYIIAYLLDFLRKEKVNPIIIIITLLFFALFPVNHLFMVNAGKDTLFSYFFLFFIITIIEMFKDKENFFKSKGKVIRLVILILLTLFWRNNMIYVFIITALIYLIVLKKYRLKWLIIMIVTIVPYFVVTGPVYDSLGIRNSNTREMMSIPAQSIVNIYTKNSDNISNNDKKMIKYYFGTNNVEELKVIYRPFNGDNTKVSIKNEKLLENTGDFVKLFLSLSFRYPVDFLEAFLSNTLGYWYPNINFPNDGVYPQKYIEYTNSTYEVEMMTDRYDYLPFLSNYYLDLGEGRGLSMLGPLAFLGNMGLILWVYLFFIAYSIYKKRYNILLYLVPLALLFATNLLGPVVIFRYVYYLLISMILFVVLSFRKE